MISSDLADFYTAVAREAYRIAGQPDLFWQQVYNRLQWNSELAAGVLHAELEKRMRPGAPAWLRTRLPFRESRFLVKTLFGHSGAVNCCTISPDGKFVISGGTDYTVKVWDVATGQVRLDLRGHAAPVRACAIGHDGSHFVSADTEGKLCVWETATGHLRDTLSLSGGKREVYACSISPKDGLIAAACADGRLRVWDPRRHNLVAEWADHKGPVYDCHFGPDGDLIISSGKDGPIILYRLSRGGEVARLSMGSNGPAYACSCALSPSGKLVAGLSSQADLTVWELETHKAVGSAWKSPGYLHWSWGYQGATGMGFAIHPNETWAVAPAFDKTISIWEIASGKEVASLKGHTGWVMSCVISRDGRICVSAATDGTVIVWDLAAATEAREGQAAVGHLPVKGCAFSPDGRLAVSANEDRYVTVWDLDSYAERDRFGVSHSNDCLACAIDPESRWVVTTSTDNTLDVRDLRTKDRVAQLVGHDLLTYPYFGTLGCAFSPGGKLLVSAGGDKTLILWTTESWKKAGQLSGHEDRVMACTFGPDGRTVFSAGFDHTVRIWDVAGQRELATLRDHRGPVYCCAVSPDGSALVSGGGGGIVTKDFKVRLWDARSGVLRASLTGHLAPVRACAFTPDGAYFITAGEDGALKVWESASGKTVAAIDLGGKLYSAAIHPWRLLAGCGDQGGNFQLLDLLGIGNGPIVTTVCDLGEGPRLRCPVCGRIVPAKREWLGRTIACPSSDCAQSIRLNPFISTI